MMTTLQKPTIVRKPMRKPEAITRVVFGLPKTDWVEKAAAMLNVDVVFAGTAEAGRKASIARTDTALVVPVKPEDGLLSVAKLATALPTVKIVLLAPYEDERVAQFAEFIDAGIAYADGSAEELANAIR